MKKLNSSIFTGIRPTLQYNSQLRDNPESAGRLASGPRHLAGRGAQRQEPVFLTIGEETNARATRARRKD